MAKELPKVSVYPARYWSRADNGRLQCDLCPRRCSLQEGQRGVCFVRMRQDDQIVLTTYGRSTGSCVDPIEKKPLNHFYPGSAVLSFGTAGCNLKCKFCQNWDISTSRQTERSSAIASPETIARMARELECRSVAFTYNDPVIFLEYAVDVAKACHALGIKTVAVTAGEICDLPRREFFEHIDAANVDLKSFDDQFYKKLCGGDLATVLATLRYLYHETKVWFELTTLLIPGENDTPEEIDAMTKWVAHELGPEVPMHFTAFHPDWKMLDYPPTPPATLAQACEIAAENGIQYAYTGNVHDRAHASTRCTKCKTLLIERDWHQLTAWALGSDGCCPACGQACDGRFDTAPGRWGGKRLPVSPGDFEQS